MKTFLFNSFLLLLFAYPTSIFILLINTKNKKDKFKKYHFLIDKIFLRLLILEIVMVALYIGTLKEIGTFIIILGIALITAYLDHLHEKRK